MNNKKTAKLSIIILVMFLYAFSAKAYADDVQLYVHNKLYLKPIFLHKGIVYAAVEDLAPLLQMKEVRIGKLLCAASQDYTGKICPEADSKYLLYINGKAIRHGLFVSRGKLFISVKLLAALLDYSYDYNPETQIADLLVGSMEALLRKENAPSSPSEKSKEKSQPQEPQPKEKSGEEKAGVVQVQNLSKVFNPRTYEVWVSFNVVNTANREIKNVSGTLQFLDGYGKPLETRDFSVGTMSPGQKMEKQDYWNNPGQFYSVDVKVQLDWEGKDKE